MRRPRTPETATFTISAPSAGYRARRHHERELRDRRQRRRAADRRRALRWAAGNDGGGDRRRPGLDDGRREVTGGPTSVATAQRSHRCTHPCRARPHRSGTLSRVRYDPPTGAEMGLEFGGGGLADGDYAVRLFMGNSYEPGPGAGQRQFDVTIEGALAFDNVDLVARFGQRVGGMLEWQGAVTDGTIDIDFRHVIENPLIHGVEVLRIDDTLLL